MFTLFLNLCRVEAAREKQRRLAASSKVLKMNKFSTEVISSPSAETTPATDSPAHWQAQHSGDFLHVPQDVSGEIVGTSVKRRDLRVEACEDTINSPREAVLAEEQMEALVARDTFEGMLETLSRAKDSIARATRHALDCAKFGIVDQVFFPLKGY